MLRRAMPMPVRLLLVLTVALLAACSDGSPPTGAPAGGDFVLQATAGPFDTRAQRGKVLMIFFGYTNCPDICPTFLGTGAQALNRLAAAERGRVKLVLVSVDPQRDTPAGLATYTAFFPPDMIGVTGTEAQVAAAAQLFGAAYVRQPPRSDGAYAVDHSAQTYVVGPDGKLAATLDLGTPVDKVVDTIRKLL